MYILHTWVLLLWQEKYSLSSVGQRPQFRLLRRVCLRIGNNGCPQVTISFFVSSYDRKDLCKVLKKFKTRNMFHASPTFCSDLPSKIVEIADIDDVLTGMYCTITKVVTLFHGPIWCWWWCSSSMRSVWHVFRNLRPPFLELTFQMRWNFINLTKWLVSDLWGLQIKKWKKRNPCWN